MAYSPQAESAGLWPTFLDPKTKGYLLRDGYLLTLSTDCFSYKNLEDFMRYLE